MVLPKRIEDNRHVEDMKVEDLKVETLFLKWLELNHEDIEEAT